MTFPRWRKYKKHYMLLKTALFLLNDVCEMTAVSTITNMVYIFSIQSTDHTIKKSCILSSYLLLVLFFHFLTLNVFKLTMYYNSQK